MRRLFVRSPVVEISAASGPTLIAIGLLMLIAAILCPAVPIVTAMALVALGATSVTLGRFRGMPAGTPVILLHLTIYGGLYALFVGATLQAMSCRVGTVHQLLSAGDGGHFPPYVAGVDLLVSTWPAAIALERICQVLRRAPSQPPRS